MAPAGLSLPTVVFVVPAALCGLSWLGAAAWLPASWRGRGRLLEFLTCIAVGTVAVSSLFFVLGRAGAFEPWLLVALTAVLAAAGAPAAIGLVRGIRIPPDRLAWALLALVALALLVDVVAASAPPTSGDALKYHLTLPERWLEHGEIDDPFWRYEAFSPFAVEMLFAQGLALAGGETAGVIGAFFAVLSALAVFALGRELGAGDALAGAAAAALFTLQGILTWVATSAFVDQAMSFYAPLAATYIVRYLRTRGVADGVRAGFAAGALAAVKYVGLLAGAVLALPIAVAFALAARWRLLAAAVAAAVVACAPWYAKNLLVTGNPFYPLLFGGKGWDQLAEDEVAGLGEGYGVGGPVPRLLLLPYDLVVSGDAFDHGRYVGIAILVLAPIALLLRPRLPTAVLLLSSLLFLAVWWEQSPQARYLMPILAVLAAPAGVVAAAAVRAGAARRAAVAALGAAAIVAWAASSAALTRQLLPVTLGLETRDDFVQRLTGTYDALRAAANDVEGVAAIAGYLTIYHYPGDAIQLGQPEFGPDIGQEELLRRLWRYGVTDIIVGRGEPGVIVPLSGCVRQVRVLRAHLVVSRTRGGTYPYRFVVYEPTCGPYAGGGRP